MKLARILLPTVLLSALTVLTGCHTGSSASPFAVTGSSSSVLLGKTVQFTGANGTASSWTVNGVSGGSATLGTITTSGLYTAPPVLPSTTALTIAATSGSTTASASLTIQSDIAVSITAPTANPILTQSTVALSAGIASAGAPSTAVTWTVGGVANGNATVGTITVGTGGAATYTAPSTQPSASVQIIATSVADPSKSATLIRTVQGIVLSATTSLPGQSLSVTGHFTTGTTLNMFFADSGTYSINVPVTPTSSSTASVIIPAYISSAALGAQGTVTVSASQTLGSTTTTLGSNPGFVIQALPAVTSGPGVITTAFLGTLNTGVTQTKSMWDTLATASKGGLTVTTTDNASSDAQTQLRTLYSAVSTIATTPLTVGTMKGSTAQLTSSNIVMMDQLLQAFILNNPTVQANLRASLAARGLKPSDLSPDELTKATAFSFLGLSASQLAEVGTIFVACALGAPAVAVVMAAVFVYDVYVETTKNNAAVQTASGTSIVDQFNPATALQQQIVNILSTDQFTPSTSVQSLQTDFNNEVTTLSDTNPTSEIEIAIKDQPTIDANEPKPITAPTSSPTLTLTPSSIAVQGGGALLDVSFSYISGGTYSISPSWSTPTTVITDYYGLGETTLVVPAPTSGSCYSGTVSLLDASGATIASQSGCFAATLLADRAFQILQQDLLSGADITINGVDLGARSGTQQSGTAGYYTWKICNVPDGKTFTVSVAVTQLNPFVILQQQLFLEGVSPPTHPQLQYDTNFTSNFSFTAETYLGTEDIASWNTFIDSSFAPGVACSAVPGLTN